MLRRYATTAAVLLTALPLATATVAQAHGAETDGKTDTSCASAG